MPHDHEHRYVLLILRRTGFSGFCEDSMVHKVPHTTPPLSQLFRLTYTPNIPLLPLQSDDAHTGPYDDNLGLFLFL